MIQEKLLLFGSERNLSGIVSLPDDGHDTDGQPAVIFLNAGMLHQVGPHCMNVEFCRALADRGFLSFRFDLSGIGDSPSSPQRRSHEDQVAEDIRSAMDLLQKKYAVDRFVLAGLCTGADNAHKSAVRDSRVCGLVQMDGYAYPTRCFELNRYSGVLADPKRLINFLLRHANLSRKEEPPAPAVGADAESAPTWSLPPQEQTMLEMAQFIQRKVRLLLIFSGASLREYNYCGQVRDMYRPLEFGDCLEEIFNIEADHIYMLKRDREKLQGQIVGWVERHFRRVAAAS